MHVSEAKSLNGKKKKFVWQRRNQQNYFKEKDRKGKALFSNEVWIRLPSFRGKAVLCIQFKSIDL